MKNIIKKTVLIILSLNIIFPIFGQQTLSNLNTSWTNVIPGSVITQPALTSYGFCLISDARLLSAFSNEGKPLWEKPVPRSRNLLLSALPGDFIALIDNSSKTIKILNPSGGQIWSKKLDYTVSSYPFAGRDGRFFIKGENVIECYGMNGVCKWRMETPQQKKMSLQELPDGSIIVFLNELQGKTQGLRISPFGQQLEEILFAGEITNAFTCSQGILLTFEDGSSGLFTEKEGLAQNKWLVQKKTQYPYFAVTNDGENFVFLELMPDSVIVNEIDKDNGSVLHSIKIQGIDGLNLKKSFYNQQGLFLCDQKSACLYNTNGNELWSAKVPYSKNKEIWNYLIYTQNNYLIFCFKDWTINAYHIAQANLEKESKTFSKDYSSFTKLEASNMTLLYTNSFEDYLIKDELAEKLSQGFYGQDESKWISDILSVCSSYSTHLSQTNFGTRKELSVFEEDSTGFAKILEELLLLGNIESQNCAASILSKSKNKSIQKIILNGIAQNAYDPDGNLLDALELLANKLDYKETLLISSVCDAVYSICLYMGRPAYNSKGKDIIKTFLYPSYDFKTRTYARDTLKKIINLEL
ncbi:MAG: hypothetical protein K6C97_06695 [Treponema sp.]|nr:hypothetical protein [Treponema sp.]